ncbi:MAG: hypothetical protein DME55_14695, partial [Verrucomicrobia bacterium]
EHRWRRFVCNAPILGGSPEASYQHDSRRSFSATLQIHLATATNVEFQKRRQFFIRVHNEALSMAVRLATVKFIFAGCNTRLNS